MAEIQQNAGSGRQRRTRQKKLSTRVDLTPMVDLGFLLITFFIFTTTMSQPNAMKLVIPAGDGDPTTVAEQKTLNLVLAADNKVHFYIGNDMGNQGCTDFSPAGVRSVIQLMQKEVKNRFGNSDETVILIRPTDQSCYMNLVDILDELHITGVKRYALMDPPAGEISKPGNLKQPC